MGSSWCKSPKPCALHGQNLSALASEEGRIGSEVSLEEVIPKGSCRMACVPAGLRGGAKPEAKAQRKE